MKKFYQTENYPTGDCFRTCVASILNCDKLEDVPNFMKDGEENFESNFGEWLNANGYMEISFELEKSKLQGKHFKGQLCILSGTNRITKIRHSIVARVEYDKNCNNIEYFYLHDPVKGNNLDNYDFDFVSFVVKRLDI